MTADQALVTLAGLALVAWINWYFFLAVRSAAVAAPAAAGAQRIRVAVRGGYDPARIRVRAGAPVELEFTRGDANSCTEEVLIPDFGLRAFLPTGVPVTLRFTPAAPGRHEFTCGMGMVRGAIDVEPSDGGTA